MRSEPLRVELGEVRQQLVEAVQAREDMSEVWEQLLEGNARLRREKALLETAIGETPMRPGLAPDAPRLAMEAPDAARRSPVAWHESEMDAAAAGHAWPAAGALGAGGG